LKKHGRDSGSGSGTAASASGIGSGSSGGFGSGLISFIQSKRKKSAPEVDIKKNKQLLSQTTSASIEAGGISSNKQKQRHQQHQQNHQQQQRHQQKQQQHRDQDDDFDNSQKSYIPSESSNNGALATYYVYLNDSCCVEVFASQNSSTAHNILNQVRNILTLSCLIYIFILISNKMKETMQRY
jgi:hypothetical protein